MNNEYLSTPSVLCTFECCNCIECASIKLNVKLNIKNDTLSKPIAKKYYNLSCNEIF